MLTGLYEEGMKERRETSFPLAVIVKDQIERQYIGSMLSVCILVPAPCAPVC